MAYDLKDINTWIGKGEERTSIPPKTRKAVWEKRLNNKTEGLCYCCKKNIIQIENFVCGHRRAVASGGTNNLGNLEPICHPCNSKMGKHYLETFCKKIRAENKEKAKTIKEPVTKKKTPAAKKSTTAKKQTIKKK